MPRYPPLPVPHHFIRIEASPHIPGFEDTSYIHNQLRIAQEELRRIEIELALLLSARSHAIKYIARCRTSLAPYSKLPAELIGMIARMCVLDSHFHTPPLPLRKEGQDPRLQITQICSSWRRVAFGVSDLWVVNLKKLPTTSMSNLIAAWFRQCSNMRLVLTMRKDLNLPLQFRPGTLISDVIIPNSRRFYQLGPLPVGIRHLADIPFDNLLILSFRFVQSSSRVINAPSLKSLEVINIKGIKNSTLYKSLPQVPWEKLTSLFLDGELNFKDVHQVLGDCSSLERCSLCTIKSDSQTAPEYAPLNLPTLSKLEIEFAEGSSFHELLIFEVPNITSLSINIPLTDSIGLLDIFNHFITNIGKNLSFFELLATSHITTFDLRHIFNALQSITHIRMVAHPIPSSVLAEIGTDKLLPNLKILEFRAPFNHPTDRTLNPPVARKVLKSRLRGVSMYVHVWDPESVDDWVSDMITAGIDAMIKHPVFKTFEPMEDVVENFLSLGNVIFNIL